jgi:hypothetical protein
MSEVVGDDLLRTRKWGGLYIEPSCSIRGPVEVLEWGRRLEE